MTRLSFLFAFCLLSVSIPAQRMAEFQLDDERALQIGEEELELLLEKKWYANKFIYHEKETFKTHGAFLKNGMIFYKDRVLEIGNVKSTWSIHPEKLLLNIHVPNKSMTRLSGSFAIWEISDSSLVLAKVLTSKQDQVFVHYFTNHPSESFVLVKDAAYLERRESLKKEEQNQKDKLEFEELVIEGRNVKVRKLERQDLFMRNIRPEKGFVYYHTESGKLLKIATKEE